MSVDASVIISTVASPPIDPNLESRTLLGSVLPMFENGYYAGKRPILVKDNAPVTDPTIIVRDRVAFSTKPEAIIFASTVHAQRGGSLQYIFVETPNPVPKEEQFIINCFLHAIITNMNSSSVLVDKAGLLQVASPQEGKRRLPNHHYSDILRVLKSNEIGVQPQDLMYVLIGSQNKFEKGSMIESTAVLSVPQPIQEVAAAISRKEGLPTASPLVPTSPALSVTTPVSKPVVTNYEAGSYVQYLRARAEDPYLTYKEFLAKHARKK